MADTKSLRALLEKAMTEEPWELRTARVQAAEDHPDSFQLIFTDGVSVVDCCTNAGCGPILRKADADLIVAAVNALPDLLDRLEKLEAVVEEAEHISEFAVHGQALTPGDIRHLTEALDRLEATDG